MKTLFIFVTLFVGEPDIRIFTKVMDADACAVHAAKLEASRATRLKHGWTHMEVRCVAIN